MTMRSSYFLCFLSSGMLLFLALSMTFDDLFEPYWAPDHIIAAPNDPLKLTLDNSSGCGLVSKKTYVFGQASMQIKLVPGDSAGTVTAFYMSSEGSNHDELDFEFLGNVSGEPYLVQTNIYVNGTGNREQRHTLWFDPTLNFHNYSILWTPYHARFLVDGIPIRLFFNNSPDVPYPSGQPMSIYASVYNADDWATQGGQVKTNWTHAPFVTEVLSFDVTEATGNEQPGWGPLTPNQQRQLRWVRAKHLEYDYCDDVARFTQMPPEC